MGRDAHPARGAAPPPRHSPADDNSPALTGVDRGVRATIANLGRRGVIDLVHRTTAAATRFAAMLERAPDFELLAPVTTSVVAFRFTGTTGHAIDAVNHDLPALLCRRGNVFLTGTILRGCPALRVCLLNPLVTEDDFRLLIAEIRAVGADFSER